MFGTVHSFLLCAIRFRGSPILLFLFFIRNYQTSRTHRSRFVLFTYPHLYHTILPREEHNPASNPSSDMSCIPKWNWKRLFRSRMVSQQNGNELFCPFCSNKFPCVEVLHHHLSTLPCFTTEITCKICKDRFTSGRALLEHAIKEHCDTSTDRRFGCPACSQKLESIKELANHVQSCSDMLTSDSYMCPLCSLSLMGVESILTHVLSKHYIGSWLRKR